MNKILRHRLVGVILFSATFALGVGMFFSVMTGIISTDYFVKPFFWFSCFVFAWLFRDSKPIAKANNPLLHFIVLGLALAIFEGSDFLFTIYNIEWWKRVLKHLPLMMGGIISLLLFNGGFRSIGLKKPDTKNIYLYVQGAIFLFLFLLELKVDFSLNVQLALLSYFLMAFAQEVFFRAGLQNVLQSLLGWRTGLLLANAAFVLYHLRFDLDPMGIKLFGYLINIFLMGLVFAYYYGKTRNLLAVTWIHFCYNAFSFALRMTEPSF